MQDARISSEKMAVTLAIVVVFTPKYCVTSQEKWQKEELKRKVCHVHQIQLSTGERQTIDGRGKIIIKYIRKVLGPDLLMAALERGWEIGVYTGRSCSRVQRMLKGPGCIKKVPRSRSYAKRLDMMIP
jgi:hypothetical protein